ncbi:MAG: DNA polymerase/3'-5' exonuclease PolX [Bryobacteraceae bacterium]|nr:DNA polymerase/3'-5' exonuclease PolX [Bryobacteraceae bacterium]
MENREIAILLSETGDLMEIAAEDGFRIRSYRNAAGVIEGYPERLEEICADPARKLTDIPGIGKGIAAVVAEILKRGSFDKRDELLEKFPPTALELLKIQGLGPKSIALLIQQFGIATVDDLERLCREQKLRTLPRMGAKLEEKVLRSIEQYRSSTGRYLLPHAQSIAEELTQYLLTTPGVERVTVAGSLRRGRETVGDLDLLVSGPNAAEALQKFTTFSKVQQVLGNGPNKASATVGLERIQVDVRAVPVASYGAAMQYFTGSKDHNVQLRQRALRLGLTLNEYGLFRLEGGERVAGDDEAGIYQALGLPWIPPELRENGGELEAAEEGTLPELIGAGQIRGDLHMHTRETDGRATLEEMAAACRELGYEYLAITDHSKALAMANGLDEARAIAFARQVHGLNSEQTLGIRVYAGIECDILRDGTMDLAADALAELDWVIGSIHSHMNLEASEMTDRLLRCIESPWLRALGHLTGRMLLHRDGYPFDFDKVAAAASARGVLLEINASPERLDIYGPLLRTAKAKGCRFVINTDAHHPRHLRNMPYGLLTARRGWLTARDVVNTMPLGEFDSWLKGNLNRNG